MTHPDILIIGGGIVGMACAWELARDGHRVEVLEGDVPGSGATAAGMGHVVVMEENEPEFALTLASQALWRDLADSLPREAEYEVRGTLWVAADEEEMQAARDKQAHYKSRNVPAELLDAAQLAEAEPQLRDGLVGGLLVREDGVTYPPAVAAWLARQAIAEGASVRAGLRVAAIHDGGVSLTNGERLSAGNVLCAAGSATAALLPEVPVRPRKGHLAITDRYPGFLHHQLVELGYLKSAHGNASESVAFNAQPRKTGQILIGSSREYGADTRDVNPSLLARMLQRAAHYLPALPRLRVTRVWTGFRAATPDGHPLIGPLPGREGVWLATGHEGLGITTSLGTAQLVADLMAGREPRIPPAAYAPARFALEVAHG